MSRKRPRVNVYFSNEQAMELAALCRFYQRKPQDIIKQSLQLMFQSTQAIQDKLKEEREAHARINANTTPDNIPGANTADGDSGMLPDSGEQAEGGSPDSSAEAATDTGAQPQPD